MAFRFKTPITRAETTLFSKATASLVALSLVYSTVAVPKVQAGFWEDRRRAAGGQGESLEHASLSQVLPLGERILRGYAPVAGDRPDVVSLRTASKKALPSWMTGLVTPYAEVEDFRLAAGRGAASGPLVLLVQDIHGHVEAQENISKFLSEVDARYGLRMVGLEGAEGAFDHGVFRRASAAADLAFAADFLVKHRLIGGAEHFALTAPREPFLWGVEKTSSYLSNVAAYLQTVPLQSGVKAYESRLSSVLAEVKSNVFTPELKDLDRKADAYAEGNLGLGEYLSFLSAAPGLAKGRCPEVDTFLKAYALEKAIDFKKAEAERGRLVESLTSSLNRGELEGLVAMSLDFRAGKVSVGEYYGRLKSLAARRGVDLDRTPALKSYIDYALASDRIRKDALFGEISALEKAAGDLLAVTAEQKEALSLTRDARLLGRLFHQQMTPQDWVLWKERRGAALRLNDRLAAFGLPLPSLSFPADPAVFEGFYVHAFARNGDLLDNFLAAAPSTAPAPADRPAVLVLVTGGFHTAGLRDLLAARNMSFAVLTPRLTAIDKSYNYLDVFSRGGTPLEQMMLGRTVFLESQRPFAQKPAPGQESARQAATGALALVLVGLGAAASLSRGAGVTREQSQAWAPVALAAAGLSVSEAAPLSQGRGALITFQTPNDGAIEETVEMGGTPDADAPVAFTTPDADHRAAVSARPASRRGASRLLRLSIAPIAGAVLAFAEAAVHSLATHQEAAAAVLRQVSHAAAAHAEVATGLFGIFAPFVAAVGILLSVLAVGIVVGKSGNGGEVPAGRAGEITALVAGLRAHLERAQSGGLESWRGDAPAVLGAVRQFLDLSEKAFDGSKEDPSTLNLLLDGVQTAIALPQMSGVLSGPEGAGVAALQERLTDFWTKLGEVQGAARLDGIEEAVKGVKGPALAARMKTAHVVRDAAGKTVVEDLPAEAWSPYSAEYWAPYLDADTLKALISAMAVDLDESNEVALPALVGRLDVKLLRSQAEAKLSETDRRDPTKRLLSYVDLENEVRKKPQMAVKMAEQFGYPMKTSADFGAFMRDFMAFTVAMKRRENWEAKKSVVMAERGDSIRGLKDRLHLSGLKDEVLAARLLSLNIPFSVLEKVARGEMRPGSDYRRAGENLLKEGRVRNLLMAGGAASRWKSSLDVLIKLGLVDEADVPDGLPRALAAYWLGGHGDAENGFTGVRLAIDSLGEMKKKGYKAVMGYVLSPFTWKDFMKDAWTRLAAEGGDVSLSAIAQNSGKAMGVDAEGTITGERLAGKVLGHGNVRGWPLAVMDALRRGIVFDVAHSADNPFSQLTMDQFTEITGRMSEEGLAHVSLGNWRSIGQAGGGFTDVNGVPNVVDTAISKKDNGHGYVADRDIALFSLFIGVFNNAALLYALSGGISVEGAPLLTWPGVLGVSKGDRAALSALSRRLARLTPDQESRIVENFVGMLPSEYVVKSEGGKDFIQWEQISGMLHGEMAKAIRARQEEEGVAERRPLSLAYVDISAGDYKLLQSAGGRSGYLPTFLEVKSGGDLLMQLPSAGEISSRLAEGGVFSGEVARAARAVAEPVPSATKAPGVPRAVPVPEDASPLYRAIRDAAVGLEAEGHRGSGKKTEADDFAKDVFLRGIVEGERRTVSLGFEGEGDGAAVLKPGVAINPGAAGPTDYILTDPIENTDDFASNNDGLRLADGSLPVTAAGSMGAVVRGGEDLRRVVGDALPETYAPAVFTRVPEAHRARVQGILDRLMEKDDMGAIAGALRAVAEANGVAVDDLEVVIMDRAREAKRETALASIRESHPGLSIVKINNGTVAHGLEAVLGWNAQPKKIKVVWAEGKSNEAVINLAVAAAVKGGVGAVLERGRLLSAGDFKEPGEITAYFPFLTENGIWGQPHVAEASPGVYRVRSLYVAHGEASIVEEDVPWAPPAPETLRSVDTDKEGSKLPAAGELIARRRGRLLKVFVDAGGEPARVGARWRDYSFHVTRSNGFDKTPAEIALRADEAPRFRLEAGDVVQYARQVRGASGAAVSAAERMLLEGPFIAPLVAAGVVVAKAVEASVAPSAGRPSLDAVPEVPAGTQARVEALLPAPAPLLAFMGVPAVLRGLSSPERTLAERVQVLRFFAFFQGVALPEGDLEILTRADPSFENAEALRRLLNEFRRRAESPDAGARAEAGNNFGAHVGRILEAATAGRNGGEVSSASLEALMASLLIDRERYSREVSGEAHKGAMLTLLQAVSAAPDRSLVGDSFRPEAWGAAQADVPNAYVEEITEDVLKSPERLDRMARTLAAALDRDEVLYFTSQLPAEKALEGLRRLKSRVDVMTQGKTLGVHGQASLSEMAGEGRFLRGEGLLTPLGLFAPGAVYEAVRARHKGYEGKTFNLTFSTPDASHWDRSAVPADLRERLQFLIMDFLKDVVIQELPYTETEVKAVQILNYQA